MNGQAVAGIHHQAQVASEMGAFLNAHQLLHTLGVVVRFSISAGVQLNHRRADIGGSLNLALIGIDKQRYADTGFG